MPQITISPNFNLFYLDENSSSQKAVLLLHGLGSNGSSWRLQIPELTSAGFRVIAPDARGFGHSGFPGGKLSIKAMASDFARVIEQLDIKPAHVIGISMGGTHALQLALDCPDYIKSMILVNTFASLRPKKASLWFYYGMRVILLHVLGMETQAKFVAKKIFPQPDMEPARIELYNQIMQANPRAYRQVMMSFGTFNIAPRLSQIKIPTLVITAENDETVSPSNQKILADNIPNAAQIFIPNAGHAVIVDQYAAFNRAILEFLQSR